MSVPRKLICLLGVALFVCDTTPALEPVRTGQEAFISRAIFAERRLWLLTDAGTLSAIDERAQQLHRVDLPEPAFDLWKQDGCPMVVTGQRRDTRVWTVRRWKDGAWQTVSEVPAEGDTLLAAGSSADKISILTSRRLIELAQDHVVPLQISWPTQRQPPGLSSIHITAGRVFIGVNAGEWGGGLWSLDRKTGEISRIQAQSTLRCALLDPNCDPVTGIADEPGKPGCVVVSVGLVHFMSHGRIVEVCGTAIRQLYAQRVELQGQSGNDDWTGEAFFGLSAFNDELWAVSPAALYEIAADGSAKVHALPPFHQVGFMSVSFADPHVVLVRTDVNQRRSISGSVPILVPR